ncbi:MAG: hypothetical protein ACXWR1_11420 [Bdellovibrionota bacterium]
MRLRLGFGPLLLALLAPLPAFAVGASWPLADTPRFWILGEGLGHFSFDTYYFQTRENYDASGFASAPATEDRTHYTNFRANAGFGFAPKLSLFAQADVHALFESNTDALATGAAHNANQGFGDSFVGFRWLVYRSNPTDRVYPTEWSPESWIAIAEGTWTFPMYDTAAAAKPPLGDQSNDFTGMGRVAWYTNEWLAFSGGLGYIYRTAGYAALVPWNLRADFSAQERHKARFWVDFQSLEQTKKGTGLVLNPQQPDPFPNGSLLFKSYSPGIRTANLGAGYLLSREWEAVVGTFFTATGVNSAKGWGAGLGFTWRPYQVPEIKYEAYRQRQIERLQGEKKELRRREVVKYGFRATIVKVSAQGNYIKIYYGEKDRVRIGDTFYVMPPDKGEQFARRPVAYAVVAQVQPEAAFLHVEERYYPNINIDEGFEVRRVYFENDE